MVRLDLHAQRQAEEDGAEEHFREPAALGFCTPVGIDERGQHPREEGDCLHLRVVAHLDDLEVVRAERDGHGAANRERPADPEREHQQKRAQQGDEQVGCRPLTREQQVVDVLRGIPAVLGGDRRRGHTAEHRIRPVGRVVRVCSIPLRRLMRHPHIARYVTLVHNLSVQHLRHEGVAEHEEKEDGAEGDADVFQQFLVHVLLVFGGNPLQ